MGYFANRLEQRNRSGLANPEAWLFGALAGSRSTSGVVVSPENAIEASTVWAAVRLISSTLASLPLPVYKRTVEGKEKAPSHPNYRLLHDRANADMPAFIFRELMQSWLLLYGNAYAEIERNGRGDAIALHPIPPYAVSVFRNEQGRKLYRIQVDGKEIVLGSDKILHIPGFGLNGDTGLRLTHVARDSLGTVKATEEYSGRFFANGATPSGVLMHPKALSPEAVERLKKSFTGQAQGLSNAHRTILLEEDMQFSPLAFNPQNSQLLESRKFNVTEVARWFLIPPHMLADLERATFSNIEHQAIQYVVSCIEPWCKRWESVLNWDLFGDRSDYFAEFDLRGLMRGDSASRAAYYGQALAAGWLTANEVRALENMNAIEGGDALRVPLNMGEAGEENDEV